MLRGFCFCPESPRSVHPISREEAVHNSMHAIPAQAGIQHHPPTNQGRHLGSGFRRSDEYTATGLIDALNTSSKTNPNQYRCLAAGAIPSHTLIHANTKGPA